MPYAAKKHCPAGHPAFTGPACPQCKAKRNAAADARRPSARARGYDSKWDQARAAFLAAHRHCVRCGATATVVDHITPHRGDKALFWRRSNWQAMCAPCHSGPKQAAERRGDRPSFAQGGPGPVGASRAQFPGK